MKEAKDKAEELINKMHGFTKDECILNALTCVDEIIEALKITLWHLELRILDAQEYLKDIQFYQQVKQEILNRQ